jgi:hypothetical protein
MQETDMQVLDSGNFRWREAEFFLNGYIGSCGPHEDYFSMVCYLDAFLYTLVSIEEVVNKSIRDLLHQKDIFLFLKALRNTSAHHIVLGIGLKDSKFSHPISRDLTVDESPYTFSELRLNFSELRQIFDTIEQTLPREKKTFDGARRYMAALESQNRDADYIENFMLEGLREVKSVL